MKEKYTIDENYFEKIDTPNKAYFLGLLYADGNINNKNRLVINLQEGDGEVLEKLKEDIKYTGPLQFRKRNSPRKNQKVLTFNNAKIISDLRALGLTNNKSHFLVFPDYINHDIMIHFIRGFFDGDGWISRGKKYAVTFGMICLDNFAKGIINFLNSINIEANFHYYKKGKYTIENLVYLIVGKKKDIFKLMTMFYENTNLYITRKFEKYHQCFIVEELHLYEKYASNSHTGINGGGGKPVLKLDDNNKIIKEYKSLHDVERNEKLSNSGVMWQCNRYKSNVRNMKDITFVYCYKEDYDPLHVFVIDKSMPSKTKKKVQQLDKENNLIKIWDCIMETSSEGFDPSAVVKCCKGIYPAHKGYNWQYN